MKEIKPDQIKQEQQIVTPAEEKKVRFIGTRRLKPGHTVYQWDDGVVTEAPLEEVDIAVESLTGSYVKRNKLILRKECYYITALNLRNAIKKFKKSGLHVEAN